MKRIVIANVFSIWPPVGGGQRRIFFLARALSEEFDVEIIAVERSGVFKRMEFSPTFREIRVPVDRAYKAEERKIKRRVKMSNDLAYALHWQKCGFYQSVLADRLRRAAAAVTTHPYSAYAILAARDGMDLPMVFDSQNVEAHLKRHVLGGSPADLDEIRRVEATAIRESAMTFACSSQDADTFAAEYGANRSAIRIIENGVDARGVPAMNPEQIAGIRSSLEFGDKFVAIFAGSHHFPNFRAVEIVLGLARELPDAIFLIMGTVCRYGKLRGILPKNVVCLGAVSESAKWVAFQAADAGLNPMEQGSGTNIKMFEYAAAGLAVVSTPFGARGVGLAPGSEFVETESPGFADAILALMMEDRREVRAMGLRARKRIAEIADWSVIGARYRENFHALLA